MWFVPDRRIESRFPGLVGGRSPARRMPMIGDLDELEPNPGKPSFEAMQAMAERPRGAPFGPHTIEQLEIADLRPEGVEETARDQGVALGEEHRVLAECQLPAGSRAAPLRAAGCASNRGVRRRSEPSLRLPTSFAVRFV